ncbi:MAG: CPBP family intramembrane metalloprotease [Flavobacteriales bacterium]|nr:CPBP family intramembrane metalloprotease [Flavobacteriales bacterium]
MRTPIFQAYSPGLKFLMAILVTISMLMMFGNIGGMVAELLTGISIGDPGTGHDFSDPNTVNAFRIRGAVYSLGGFLLGAILFAWFCTTQITDYFHLKGKFKLKYLLVVVLIFLISVPAGQFLSIINEMINPGNALVEQHDENSKLIAAFLHTSNGWMVLLNVLTMALVPAVGEELFFRGVILRLSYQGTKKIHLGVILSAVLFAIFHFDFENVLSITLMGVVLGYIYIYTGSLLVPMVLHFLNNAVLILIAAYGSEEMNSFVMNGNEMLIWMLVGAGALGLMLFILKRSINKEKWPMMIGSLMRD